jgi:hypothetical protein
MEYHNYLPELFFSSYRILVSKGHEDEEGFCYLADIITSASGEFMPISIFTSETIFNPNLLLMFYVFYYHMEMFTSGRFQTVSWKKRSSQQL